MQVNSPDKFDLTNRFWYVGSMLGVIPQMLEIVAVGAIAIVFELRMPTLCTSARKLSQSKVVERSISR
jgi:hypothetical protein